MWLKSQLVLPDICLTINRIKSKNFKPPNFETDYSALKENPRQSKNVSTFINIKHYFKLKSFIKVPKIFWEK